MFCCHPVTTGVTTGIIIENIICHCIEPKNVLGISNIKRQSLSNRAQYTRCKVILQIGTMNYNEGLEWRRMENIAVIHYTCAYPDDLDLNPESRRNVSKELHGA